MSNLFGKLHKPPSSKIIIWYFETCETLRDCQYNIVLLHFAKLTQELKNISDRNE